MRPPEFIWDAALGVIIGGTSVGLYCVLSHFPDKTIEVEGYSRALVCEDFTVMQWAGTERFTVTYDPGE